MRTRIAVFLITLSGLILEVGLTRIYSASIWYHFAFVAISVALLGWGLGGFTVHLIKQGLRQKDSGLRTEDSGKQLPTLSMNAAALTTLLYAGAVPLCLWLLVRYPFEMDRLPLYFLAPLAPFFLAGMALSIVFDIHRAVAGALYFYDLVGAALGGGFVTALLHVFGGEAALLVGAIAPAVAALLLALSPAGSEVRSQESEVREKQNATPSLTVGLPPRTAPSRVIQIAAVAMVLVTAGAAFEIGR